MSSHFPKNKNMNYRKLSVNFHELFFLRVHKQKFTKNSRLIHDHSR